MLIKWTLLVVVAFAGARSILQFVGVDQVSLPAGIMLETARGEPRDLYKFPDDPWVFFVGGSTVREAVEHSELTWEVRKFSEPRGMASDIALALNWTLDNAEPAHLPELVVWGVHPICFVDRKPHPALTTVAQNMWNEDIARRLRFDESSVDVSAADRLLLRLHELDPWFRQRGVIRDALEVSMRSVVSGGDGLFEGQPTWHVKDERKLRPIPFYIDRSRKLGSFLDDPVQPVHERAITVVLETLQVRDIPLIVIGMPEHSAMRASYPPGNRQAMLDRLRGPGVHVVDWFDLLPDEQLADHLHATAEGRLVFTRRLEALLDESLGRAPEHEKPASSVRESLES
jgi:hypothetical protein